MKKFQSMLALAAVALITVACGTDPVKTDTDTGTVTDTGLPSDGTTTTDTGPTDTGATTDTGVTTDTAPTDTGVTTDTGLPVDGTATAGFIGCTGATDQAYLGTFKTDPPKGQAFAAELKSCTLTKGCLGLATDSLKIKCIADCIVAPHKADGLTDPCGACYGLTGWCGAGPCLASCAVDASSPACSACIATNCDPAANGCKAGTCDPYADAHCKP